MNLKERINNIMRKQEVPRVIFDNANLQIKVGIWLKVLSNFDTTRGNGYSLHMCLGVEDYIREGILNDSDILNKINEAFGKVLLSVGIDKNETCLVSNYNERDFSFDLELVNSGDIARITLRFGFVMDDGPEFIIDYKNVKRTFEYCGFDKEGKVYLELESTTTENVRKLENN